MFFTLFGTKARAYGSTVVLQLPLPLLKLTVNGWKRVLSEFSLLLFRDTHFIIFFQIWNY